MILLSIAKKSMLGRIAILIILLTGFIALFGYAIAPDNTTNANQMHIAIANKPMGYTTNLVKITLDTKPKPFWKALFFGEAITHEEIPVNNAKFILQHSNIILKYQEITGEEKTLTTNLDKDFMKNSMPDKKAIKRYYIKKTFWLGTDKYGRDFLSRLIIGARISFLVGFIAIFISILLGVTLGALSGYFGGWIDAGIMWFVNIIWSIPTLLLVIAITLALGKGFWQIFIAIGLSMWVEVARITRGQFISLKEKEFVEAGKALGFSHRRIIFKHILPNAWGAIIVISAANFASAILIESGLSFLGVGAQLPTPTWGNIIKEHYGEIILGYPHLALAPGICILILMMSFMILGNQLRDALDVK